MKKIVACIGVFFVMASLFANQEDSLLYQLKIATTPVQKTEILHQLSSISTAQQAVVYATQAIAVAKEIKNDSLLAIGYLKKSKALYLMGKLETALAICDSALTISTKKKYSLISFSANRTIGNVYRRKKKITESLSSFLQCEAIAIQLNNDTLRGDAYSCLGILYSTINDIPRSENYHLQSLDYFKKANDFLSLSYSYENLGILKRKQEKYTEAITLYNKALKIRLAEKDSSAIAFTYNDIGAAYMYLNNTKEADKYLKLSIGIRERNNELIELPYTYFYLGSNEEKKGNARDAEKYLKTSLNIATTIKNNKQIIEATQDLSTFFERIQKKDSALLYLQKATQFKDSIEAIAKNELTNELTIKYETVQKDKLIQEQQLLITKRTYTIVGIIAGILVIAALLWLWQSKKALTLKNEQQQQLTKAIIEAEEAERKRIASDLHDGVGQLFSAVKMNLNGLLERVEITKDADKFLAEKTMALVDESCKEVRVISHKMMPNFLLKSGIASDIRSFIEKVDEHTLKINFETKGFKEQLEFNEEVILYRVIQELINNVIKHAGANELNLLLEKNNKQIQVQVADNGKGFNYQAAKAKGGLGLKNILVRIEYLKGTIDFLPNTPTGTKVLITIPIA